MTEPRPTCPCCGLTETHVKMVQGGYTFYVCHSCDVMFLFPKPVPDRDDAYGEAYYSKSDLGGKSGYANYAQDFPIHRRNFTSYAERVRRFVPAGGRVLDVGCALGAFLDCMRERDFQVSGVDVSGFAIEWMKTNLDIPGYVGGIDAVPDDQPFEAITAFEVIEHVWDQVPFVEDISRRLVPDGVLVVATGERNSPLSRLLGRRWWYVNPPDHCIYHNRKSLRLLLESCGFKIELHRRLYVHRVGILNVALKLTRMFPVLGSVVRLVMPLLGKGFSIPIIHGTGQFIVARRVDGRTDAAHPGSEDRAGETEQSASTSR